MAQSCVYGTKSHREVELMPQGIYIGVNGAPRNVKEMYVGVDGQPRKVKEGYVGVGGVPKMFYSAFPAKDTLENTSWADIQAISKAGKAYEYWAVGDIKGITFKDKTYYVQIIGFDHDDPVDVAAYGRDKAGITFQFGVANDPEKAGMYSQTYKMKSSNTNVGGWESSLIRTDTMPLMKSYMMEDLRSVIVQVKKLTSEGNKSSNIITTSDDLWLLSEIEIFGKTTYSVAGEGEQYKFYKDGNSTVRYRSGSAYYWWERSPNSSNSTSFCNDSYGGNASSNGASNASGVSFGFCV